MARNYKNIAAWQRSHQFAVLTYRLTASLPADERFGLVSQMRRAAASVPANIAEGAVRDSSADFVRFLTMALGSLNELEYFMLLSKDLGYVSESTYCDAFQQVRGVFAALRGLIKSVKSNGGL